MPLSIAIDGTAGAGKGYLSDKLAGILNICHLDTGAIYRTIAFACKQHGIDVNNESEVEKVLETDKIEIKFENQVQYNYLNGEDLGERIRNIEIGEMASIVSTYLKIREFATNLQHELAKVYDVIIEGRDIGTVVLPDAEFKFYLDATPEERARRRIKQNKLTPEEYQLVLQSIIDRDERDKTRKISPLRKADDAIYIDTTNMKKDEVVDLVLSYIKKWAKCSFFLKIVF